MEYTYKGAGVDLEAGDETVKRIKKLAKSTFTKNVISEIGLFGGFYELDLSGINNPVLVSSVDGVGTKLKIACLNNMHNTIGQDLVNHCVNDIAVCGAKPLFFLDYLAVGKLDPNVAEKVIEGFSIACRENGCALIGGETAEMPGFYAMDEYDVSGTIVGIVDKNKIINGKNISKGDVLIGFPSTGLHTNGYSLARKVLLDKYLVNDFFPELNRTLGEELLTVHKSYLKLISGLKDKFTIKGFSHITGGGIIGNTKRIVPEGLGMQIDWNNWDIPKIFQFIQENGKIADDEMRSVFNLGIGLVAVISKDILNDVKSYLDSINEQYYLVGKIV
ncbi:MAG: phosphoribosylformylglycinamidine cyclo-ligase [Bacteroidota bacterium]|nr:phosphoribosylformylglycinamidine cyclo-ligase [Bacteroidota bacterium]